jgi:hypothetical protein
LGHGGVGVGHLFFGKNKNFSLRGQFQSESEACCAGTNNQNITAVSTHNAKVLCSFNGFGKGVLLDSYQFLKLQ